MQEALSSVTANPRIEMPYPNITINNLTDALTVVINVLDKGDLPLVVHYQGRVYRVADISRSMLNINKLLKLTDIVINKSEEESVVVRTTEELLEVGVI